MRAILLFLILILPSVNAYCKNDSTQVKLDSTIIELRTFDESRMQTLLADGRYVYDRRPPVTIGWWENFKRRFWNYLIDILSGPDNPILRDILFYGFLIAVFGFAFYKLSDGNIGSLWKTTRPSTFEFSEDNAHIDELDLDALLEEAIRQQNFRRAVRLLYLKALRLLSDKALISWQPFKTNTDYIDELSDLPFRDHFINLTRLFDHIYYGDFHISQVYFQQIKGQFEAFYPIVGEDR